MTPALALHFSAGGEEDDSANNVHRPCLSFWTGVLVEEWLLSSVPLS